jgi:hypothetical protein
MRRALYLIPITLVALGVWWFVQLEPSPARAPLPEPSSASEFATRTQASLEASEASARSATDPPVTPSATTPPAKDAKHPTATIRAHCIDESGQPIAGVELYAGGWDQPTALSDQEGRISATLTLGDGRGLDLILLRSEYRGMKRFERLVRPGDVCDLFDVVLPLGGRIVGRMLAPDGRPLVGAIVVRSTDPVDRHETGWIEASVRLSIGHGNGVRTAKDGVFVFDGVPPGPTRITAISEEFEPLDKFPIEVVAGRDVTGVVIRLDKRRTIDTLDFVVRVTTPSGEPVGGAVVLHHPQHGDVEGRYRSDADEHGCAHFKIHRGLRVDFCASDPAARFAPVYALDVPADSKTIDLAFANGAEQTLVVQDEQGAAVETYEACLLDQAQYAARAEAPPVLSVDGMLRATLFDGAGSIGPTLDGHGKPVDSASHPGGRCKFIAPAGSFAIQVDAVGFALGQTGPLPGPIAPAEIRMALQKLKGVHGRVMQAGAPVASADVALYRATGDRRTIVADGFPSRMDRNDEDSTTSAADGSFEFFVRCEGDYFLRAGRKESCEAEVGPLHLGPGKGAEALTLEIPECGCIEGQVLASVARSAADVVIGASAGEGRPCSVRTDSKGRFHLDRLTPGRWLLRRLEADIAGGSTDYDENARPEVPMPSTCEVHAGETTHVDIDLRQTAALVAHFDLAGWDGAEFAARLDPARATFSASVSSDWAKSREARLLGEQPGEYDLSVYLNRERENCMLVIAQRVRLAAGENSWAFQTDVGTLQLRNGTEAVVKADLRAEFKQGRHGHLEVDVPAHGSCDVQGLPLGRWTRIRHADASEIEDGGVEVTSAATARLEWN